MLALYVRAPFQGASDCLEQVHGLFDCISCFPSSRLICTEDFSFQLVSLKALHSHLPPYYPCFVGITCAFISLLNEMDSSLLSSTLISSAPKMILVSLLAFAFLVSQLVLLNVLSQIFSGKQANKPPLVFHWFPVIGSTLSYGKDPMKFFQECKQKVTIPLFSF